jgi:putative ABC transport system permease protein
MEHFLWLTQLQHYLTKHPEYLFAALASFAVLLLLLASAAFVYRRYCLLVLKSLRRNPLRTILTSLAVMVLVSVASLIWSFLVFLAVVMSEKSNDLKAIVTERWQIPSQMPFAYAASLEEGAAKHPSDVRPEDSMTWQFFGGTIDPEKLTRENMVFFFAMDPRKLRTMMDDTEDVDPRYVDRMVQNKKGVILGRERLEGMNKRVGERFTLTGLNYKGIDLEFEIVGVFPEGRYNMSGIMNRDYLNDALDAYPQSHNGKKHPLAEKSLNLVWLRVPDTRAFGKVAEQVMSSPSYASPAVKCETAASGIATWLEPYEDLLRGAKYLLVPAVLVIMGLVVSLAISISVRERRTEVAVLKVLGFGPGRILLMVLGEAVLIGGSSGLLSAGLSYFVIDVIIGGIKFPIAFFPIFYIYVDALWWGLLIGMATALIGSLWPAWNASRVNVAEVFAKVA